MGLVSRMVGVLCDWDLEVVSGLSLQGNHDKKYEGITNSAGWKVHEKGKNKCPKMHNSLQVFLQRSGAQSTGNSE